MGIEEVMEPSAQPPRTRRRAGAVPIRHGRLHRRRVGSDLFKLLATVVAVVLVSAVGVTAYATVDTLASRAHDIHLVNAAGQAVSVPSIGAKSGEINILLAGTDTRSGQGGSFDTSEELAGSSGAGNNDVTMVLHVSADHTSATVISIPRDLMTPVPACPKSGGGTTSPESSAMFNSTLSTGGLSCVVLTAEQLTGLTIPYAALITFDGVIALSNAVGGVTVCLATPVNDPYTGLNLAAGEQTLQGANALAYLRSRHGVGDGSDLGRISDQQLFLSALLRQVTSAGVLSNPITLYTLARAAVTNMQLSDTLSQPTTMIAIAVALKNISLSNFVFLQYPVTGDPTDSGRVLPDPDGAAALQTALANDQPVQLTGTLGRATEADPTATATATPTASATPTSSAEASSSPGSTAAATTPPAVTLPPSVTGQTAAQQTCTKGNN